MAQIIEYRMDDILRLKKKHPCGSRQWQVYRLGADIGIACLGCERRVLMPRRELERYVRGVSRPPAIEAPGAHPDTDT